MYSILALISMLQLICTLCDCHAGPTLHPVWAWMARHKGIMLVGGLSCIMMVLPFLMDLGASTSQAPQPPTGGVPRMEDGLEYLQEEGHDALAQWKSQDAWDEFPDHMIPWPLSSQDASNIYYSMDQAPPTLNTTLYESQLAKLKSNMEDPPVNKTAKFPHKRPKMAAYTPGTIQTRLTNLSQFIGFCYHFLNLAPTLELCMNAQAVAKYWGFLKARGVKASDPKPCLGRLAANDVACLPACLVACVAACLSLLACLLGWLPVLVHDCCLCVAAYLLLLPICYSMTVAPFVVPPSCRTLPSTQESRTCQRCLPSSPPTALG